MKLLMEKLVSVQYLENQVMLSYFRWLESPKIKIALIVDTLRSMSGFFNSTW